RTGDSNRSVLRQGQRYILSCLKCDHLVSFYTLLYRAVTVRSPYPAIQTVGREHFGEGGRTGLIFLNGDLHSDDACGIMVIGVVAMGSQKNGLCRMMPGKRH